MVKKKRAQAKIKPKITKKLSRKLSFFVHNFRDRFPKISLNLPFNFRKLKTGFQKIENRVKEFDQKTEKAVPRLEEAKIIILPEKVKNSLKKTALGFLGLILISALVYFRPVYPYLSGLKNIKPLVVLSGSMLPILKIGSVVIIAPSKIQSPEVSKYQSGEIITFTTGQETFTHRVVKVERNNDTFFYKTKGDNNKDEDLGQIPEYKVVGKVLLHIPYLGYFMSFARSQKGYVFLIVIPATIIVYSELLNIKNELVKILISRRSLAKSKSK